MVQRILFPTLLVVAVPFFAGCSENELRSDIPRGDWSRQRAEQASPAEAFDAAKFAVAQWFTLDSVRPTDGVITSLPLEADERGDTGRIRDAVQVSNRVRRRAVVRVSAAASGATVDCIVVRQRLDSADHRVFAQQRSFEDVPNQTPIASEAPSAQQGEVWTDVGRDRLMERRILTAVRERLGQSGGATRPAAP